MLNNNALTNVNKLGFTVKFYRNIINITHLKLKNINK